MQKAQISAVSRAAAARQRYQEAARLAAKGDAQARAKLPSLYMDLLSAAQEDRIEADIAREKATAAQAAAVAALQVSRQERFQTALRALEARAQLAREIETSLRELAETWAEFERLGQAAQAANHLLGRSGPWVFATMPVEWDLGQQMAAFLPEFLRTVEYQTADGRRVLECALAQREAA